MKIAFDDFGTGYSSLSYLEKYPIDTLKIDQSFVQHMAEGTIHGEIVGMILKLAEALGMSVSAEGVETMNQVNRLKGMGCTRVQGHLFSPAVSLSDMLLLLKKGVVPSAALTTTTHPVRGGAPNPTGC